MLKKLILFSCFYPPHLGGVERYSYNLSQRLADMGIEVLVITSHHSSRAVRQMQGKVDVLYLPAYFIVGDRLAIPRIGAARLMRRAIATFGADAALINTNLYFHSMMAAKYTKKYDIDNIAICHGTGHITSDSWIITTILHMYEHYITSSMKKNVSSFGGVSKACCRYLSHFDIDAEHVVYNAYEYTRSEPSDIIDRLGIYDDSIVLAFSARMIQEKGIVDLLDAYTHVLATTDKKTQLIVAGDGPLLAPLGSKYTDTHIVFAGRLSHNEMIDVFKRSDIYISPTKYPEGLPTSILEAGLMECAVVATPMGGTPEIINEDTGIIVECGDIEALATAICTMLEDDEYRRSCASHLCSLVNENFNWTIVAKTVTDIFDKSKDNAK